MGDRRTQLTAEVTARLTRVCAHWPPADFAAMVRDTVVTTLRHEARVAGRLPDAPLSPDDRRAAIVAAGAVRADAADLRARARQAVADARHRRDAPDDRTR